MYSVETPSFDQFLTGRSDISLDTGRIILEILGDSAPAQIEYDTSNIFAKNIIIWGKKAFLLRYKDTRTNRYYPVACLSYDEDEQGNIHIIQIQWTKQWKISYRVYSTFRVFDYFIKLIELNFTRYGKRVTIDDVPAGLESVAEITRAPERYQVFQRQLRSLNERIIT